MSGIVIMRSVNFAKQIIIIIVIICQQSLLSSGGEGKRITLGKLAITKLKKYFT